MSKFITAIYRNKKSRFAFFAFLFVVLALTLLSASRVKVARADGYWDWEGYYEYNYEYGYEYGYESGYGPSCGGIGGNYCANGSCPGGYSSLGNTYDCHPCCVNTPVYQSSYESGYQTGYQSYYEYTYDQYGFESNYQNYYEYTYESGYQSGYQNNYQGSYQNSYQGNYQSNYPQYGYEYGYEPDYNYEGFYPEYGYEGSYEGSYQTSYQSNYTTSYTGQACRYDGVLNSGGCLFMASVGSSDQAWRGHVSGHTGGDPDDEVGLSACLSSNGQMWSGSCWNLVNNQHPTGWSNSWAEDIGNDPNPTYKYWTVSFYAADAHWDQIAYWVDARHVFVQNLSPSQNSVLAGDSFTVNYNVIDAISGAQLSWSGDLAGGDGSADIFTSPNGSMTFQAGQTPGVANFTVHACGATGSGYGCVDQAISVNVTTNKPGDFSLLNASATCSGDGNSTDVNLNWEQSAGATGYNIYRRMWSFGSWDLIGSTGGTSYSYSERKGVDLYYYVEAVNSTGSTIDRNGAVYAGQCPAPAASLSANPPTIDWNSSSTLSYSSAHAYQCSLSGFGNVAPNTSGSVSTGPLQNTTTYYLTCSDPDGGYADIAAATVNVNPRPAPSGWIRCNGQDNSCTIGYGASAGITWQTNNTTSCSVSPTGWSGTSGSNSTGALYSDASYTLTCAGLDGSTYTNSVGVTIAGPGASVSCNPDSVGYNGSSTISWSSSNANSCSVAPTGWSGTSGSQSTGPLTSDQTYTVTCNGNGSYSISCPVHVIGPAVNMSADPSTIDYGQSSTLSWSSSNAVSCTASGDWSGDKNLSGSDSTDNVSPQAKYQPGTHTYTLTCSGNGSGSASAQLVVNTPIPNPPANVTEVNPDYCQTGPGGTVSWTYTDQNNVPQGTYEVQVGQSGNFGSPVYDSGQINSNSTSFAIPNGVLQFNTTYQARVRVWNVLGGASGWGSSNSWTTPPYAYPQVDFTWTPHAPQINVQVPFTDQTVFGGGNPGARTWSWDFGDNGTATTQNPKHTYTTQGQYPVSLTVTDAAGQSCTNNSHTLNVQKPIPEIKEVAPK